MIKGSNIKVDKASKEQEKTFDEISVFLKSNH
jgi:hypothetical protein